MSAGGTSENTEKETGTKITLSLLKEPVLSFANDSEFTELAAGIGQEVFGERFILEGEDELFLAGDNAYRYFQRTRGVFFDFFWQQFREKNIRFIIRRWSWMKIFFRTVWKRFIR